MGPRTNTPTTTARPSKPKEGRNVYRFLAPSSAQAPWVPASGQFWADLGVHWIKADKNGKPLAVVGDVDTVYQRPSEIAAAIEAAIQSAPDEESKELYTEWRARKSVLFNVVDRNNNDDLVPLELTPTTAGKVFDLIEIYAAAGKDIFDPIEGVDIIITKTGKGLNTNYDVAVSPAVPKPLDPSILSKTIDLHEFIKQNFFRGEEQKALNYIGSIAGVAVPTLGASQIGTNTPTAALTSPAASVAHTVEDIPFEPDVLTPAVQPASTAPVAAAPSAAPSGPTQKQRPVVMRLSSGSRKQQQSLPLLTLRLLRKRQQLQRLLLLSLSLTPSLRSRLQSRMRSSQSSTVWSKQTSVRFSSPFPG